ncbi:MAG: hypothetical protein EOO10_20140 [Chitinophagaceae bacterium]|nr:MAG: hypothetical protein EOO10_20140 [Chitinophagaceae bacterium]
MLNAMSQAAEVKIAYLILAHRYPQQLTRLIQRLDDDNVVFFVHIDKKVDEATYGMLVKSISNKRNVRLIRRYTCYWAGFGIMQATLQGIREIIESGEPFDHIVLLSGQDYPIKPKKYIHSFFAKNKGISFVEHRPFPRPEWIEEKGGWDRVKMWHFIGQDDHRVYPGENVFKKRLQFLNRFWNKIYAYLPVMERKLPLQMHPYGGAQFWSLARRHALYIYSFIQKHPVYERFFRFVFVPDEILVQTIIGNAGLQDEVHNDTLHFVEWYRPGAVLVSSDKENICNTYHLFARKFDTTIDSAIMDFIDNDILINTSSSPHLEDDFNSKE